MIEKQSSPLTHRCLCRRFSRGSCWRRALLLRYCCGSSRFAIALVLLEEGGGGSLAAFSASRHRLSPAAVTRDGRPERDCPGGGGDAAASSPGSGVFTNREPEPEGLLRGGCNNGEKRVEGGVKKKGKKK